MTEPSNASSPELLIVEDDTAYAARLAKNLKLSGFRTQAAENVDEALRMLLEQPFSLVLADIRMPGRSGLDLIDAVLRAAGDGESIAPPIVMLTSVRDIETAVEAM